MFTWKSHLIYLIFSTVCLAVRIFPPLHIELNEDSLFDDIYKSFNIELPASTSADSSRPPSRAERISTLSRNLQVTPDGAIKLILFMVNHVQEIHTIGNLGIQAAWNKHMSVAPNEQLNLAYKQLENLCMETRDHHIRAILREKGLADLVPTDEAVSMAVNLHTLLIAWRTSHYYHSMTRELVLFRNFQQKRNLLFLHITFPRDVPAKLIDWFRSDHGRIFVDAEELKQVLLNISPKPPYLKKADELAIIGDLQYWYKKTMVILLLDRSIATACQAETKILDKIWAGLRNVMKDQDALNFIDIYKKNIEYFIVTHRWDDVFTYYQMIQSSVDFCKNFVKNRSNQLVRSYSQQTHKPIDQTLLVNLQLQASQMALHNVALVINYVDEFFRQISRQKEEIKLIPEPRPPQETIDDIVDSASRLTATRDDFFAKQLSTSTYLPSWSTEKLWYQIDHFITIMYHTELSKRQEADFPSPYEILKDRLKEAKSKLNEKVTLQDPPSDAPEQSAYDSAVNCALEEFENTVFFSVKKAVFAYNPEYSGMLEQAVKTLFSAVSASQAYHFKNRIKEAADKIGRECLVFRIYHYIFKVNPNQRLNVFEGIENQLKGLEQNSSPSYEDFEKLKSLYELIKANAQGPSMKKWQQEMVPQDPQCPMKEILLLWNMVEKEADPYLVEQVQSDISSWCEPDLLSLRDLSEETLKRLEAVPKLRQKGAIRSEMRRASNSFAPMPSWREENSP